MLGTWTNFDQFCFIVPSGSYNWMVCATDPDSYPDSTWGLSLHLSLSPLMMTFLLLFFLASLGRQLQLPVVQATFNIALPLLVRSPYFSCWLPQTNRSDSNQTPFGGGFGYHAGSTTSDLSQVRALSSFDLLQLRYFSLF
jgi:hypothetical protein